MTAVDINAVKSQSTDLFRRKRLFAFGMPALILAYFVYIFFAFDLPGLVQRANMDNARTLTSDVWSHKVHVTRDNRNGEISYAVEGERKGEYPEGARPDWINASDRRVAITTPEGRITLTGSRTEVFNYFAGWELFWFTLDSPYHGVGFGQIVFGAQIDPDRGNISGAVSDFWHNKMWRHKDVAWAIGETILMAFLDFVRGVDALIWTVVLARAFGPGPLTGALAILITDTGTFGKTFSEALENVDDKQIEGVTSTGAKPLQRYRFGGIPQVVPVLLAQVLYFLESNTRSATIIGAITGGGIGLMLTQAIQTQKDWEEVAYYIILIIMMVMLMDWLSGWLRGKLIGSKE